MRLSTRDILRRSMASVTIAFSPLLSVTFAADVGRSTLSFAGSSSEPEIYSPLGRVFPKGGVLFGTPPEDDIETELANLEIERGSGIIAEFDVAGGWVRFVDEGDSVSTLIKGDRETFEAVAAARTVGELFATVAPGVRPMPRAIAEVSDETLDKLIAVNGNAEGPTFEQEFEYGHDDWADGCSTDAVDLWESGFQNWHGFLSGADAFSTTDYWDFGLGSIGKAYGYFGNLDEIWFGVCMVNFHHAYVQMEQRTYSVCDDSACGSWEPIPGTFASIGFGERYLYHNHSIYSPLRRSSIESIGDADNSTWQYFISGAGSDSFIPDDQLSGG